MEAIVLGSVALGLLAWAWWTERGEPGRAVSRDPQKLAIESSSVEVSDQIGDEGMSGFYQGEYKIIEKFLKNYGDLFRVNTSGIVRTPRTIIYPLSKRSKTKVEELKTVIDSLENRVYTYRRRHGHPEIVKAAWATQPLYLSFPRVDPDTLDWNNDMQWAPSRYRTHFAKYYVGSQSHNVEIDLDSTSGFSVLLGGASGCGKSTLLDGFILNACRATHPDELKLLFIDIGGKHFQRFWDLPHTYALATTDTEAMELLTHIESELTGEEDSYTTRYLLIIDEIQRLTRHEKKNVREKFKDLLYLISSMGRAYGYSFVYATQTPKASVIPTEIRDNCAVRIAGRCKRELQSESILGDKNVQAVGIPNFTFIVSTEQNEVHAYTYRIANVETEINAAIAQYRGYEGQCLVLGENATDEPESAPATPEATGIPHTILGIFEDHDNGDGTLADGWITKAVRAYADHVNKVPKGRNFDKFKLVVSGFKDRYLDEYEYRREATTGKIIRLGNYRR